MENHDIANTDWKKISPDALSYLFIERDIEGWKAYSKFVGINDIFPVNSVGIVTSRDDFVIDTDKRNLENRIRIFINSSDGDNFIKQAFELKENERWKVSNAQKELRKVSNWEDYVHEIIYRPFDKRWIFYHTSVIERPRIEVMSHLSNDNIALICSKRSRQLSLGYMFVTDEYTDFHILDNTGDSTYVFPLYRYHKTLSPRLWNSEDKQGIIDLGDIKEVNISHKFLTSLEAKLGKGLRAEEFFNYVYAILYSSVYRQKYQVFFKSDFPKIPFTSNYELFQHLAILGEQLVELHLLKSKLLDNPLSRYEGKGDDIVEKRHHEPELKRVYINTSQYFDKVEPEVWNYYIGGYQVLDKWLKDHEGRTLSLEDQTHYRKVILALSETIEIQKKIDRLYPEVEKKLNE